MKVRTFQADSMTEAIALVKRTFGSGAIIITTKAIRAPGVRGWLGRQWIEVTAATDVPRSRHVGTTTTPGRTIRPEVSQAYRRGAVPQTTSPENSDLRKLRDEITGIRNSLDDLVRSACPKGVAGLPDKLVEGYMTLVRTGVSEQLAGNVTRTLAEELTETQLNSTDLIRERITTALADHVKVGGPIRLAKRGRRVVAMVGPTGVGKTTTIAKLAANFKVRARKRVALITIDTYRIAAVQQLQTIADIIKVPLRTVLTVGDLKQALADLGDVDLVLIDTAGRSQRDELKMNELKTFISAAAADETHLVISATGSEKNMTDVVSRFKVIGPDRLIVTKTDEAEALGKLVTVLHGTGMALSYVTTGQDIPDDIEVADATRVAQMVWENES